jgi:PadR family transcriptional regulator, regulatory protein PadR
MTPKNTDPTPQGSPPGAAQSEAFASDLLRGHTDTIVLGTLRDADRYGFEIYKTIRDATGGDYEIKEATLYATFRRLVKDGLVDAYWGDETQGGRRKYYRITDAGRAVYTKNVADWNATQQIINTLLNTAPSTNKGTN